MTQARHPSPATLGQLRATGYIARGVKTELQSNVLARLRAGQTAFPGIVGFDDTVLPELEAALLAGHDLVILGERGQVADGEVARAEDRGRPRAHRQRHRRRVAATPRPVVAGA
jgi:hypothetical protein